jgi:hypothetical protein
MREFKKTFEEEPAAVKKGKVLGKRGRPPKNDKQF